MIKLVRGNETITVPSGAVAMYVRQGWAPDEARPQEALDEIKKEANDNIKAENLKSSEEGGEHQDKGDDGSEEELKLTDEEIILLPVDEMTKSQLKRVAILKEISTDGMKTKAVREAVRKALGQ